MGTELIETIIYGVPNFAGFMMAIILLYKRLVQQDRTIEMLVQKWSDCEEGTE